MSLRLSRRHALELGGAAVFTTFLAGCGAASARAGLYVSEAEGAPRWIDNTTGSPAWSPDSQELAWGDENGLKLWNESPGSVSLLDSKAIVGRPSWSPDSSTVVYLASDDRELQSLNINSTAVTPLAKLYDGFDGAIRPPVVTRGGPAWSPDGLQIAFICWDGQGDELCIVDADGRAKQKLTTLSGTGAGRDALARSSVTSMAWSPDSTALAVSVQAEVQGATSGIFRVELAARSGRRLTKMTTNASLIWEQATDDLIYSATVEGRSDVYRLPATGGKPDAITTILPDGGREPAIDNAGSVAVVSGSRIALMRPGARAVTYIEQTGLACSVPAFSANGRRLAFLALPRPIEQYP